MTDACQGTIASRLLLPIATTATGAGTLVAGVAVAPRNRGGRP